MIRLLLALHSKARRRTHGEEFAVLLEKSRLTPLALAIAPRRLARPIFVRASPGTATGFAGVGCPVPLDLADRD